MKTSTVTTALVLGLVSMLSIQAMAQDKPARPFKRLRVVQQDEQTPMAVQAQPYIQDQPAIEPQPYVQAQPAIQPQPFIQNPTPHVDPLPVLPTLPPTCDFIPQLQFQGVLVPNYGIEVVSTQFGGVAQRAGLETGDIIIQINGRRIRTDHDYELALINAAIYGEGHVDLVIRNVRFRPGCSSNPKFVNRHVDLPRRSIFPVAAIPR